MFFYAENNRSTMVLEVGIAYRSRTISDKVGNNFSSFFQNKRISSLSSSGTTNPMQSFNSFTGVVTELTIGRGLSKQQATQSDN
jgi:hypothetical protein